MQGKLARCRKCHRRLRKPEAIVVGYGPVCYRRLFGASPPTPLANLAEKDVASRRPRRVAGHQISIFEIGTTKTTEDGDM